MGAKPVLIDMFEAEIPPNLRGVDFFPITHRYARLFLELPWGKDDCSMGRHEKKIAHREERAQEPD